MQLIKKLISHHHFKELLPLAISLVVLLIVFFPYLFKEYLFIEGDAIGYYYPVFRFYNEALNSGQSFLWNPYIFSGFPTYLSQSAGLLDPLNALLHSFLPYVEAYNLRILINCFLAIVFSYVFGRSLGLSRAAAFVIGFGYILAFGWRLTSNLIISNTFFVLPMLMLAVWKLKEYTGSGRWRQIFLWMCGPGVLLGWSFYHAYIQIIIYDLFIAGVFALLLAYNAYKNAEKKHAMHFLATCILIVGIGVVVGAPAILAPLKHVPLSIRAEGLDYSVTTFKSIEPGDIFNFVLPDTMRIPYIYQGRKTLYIGFFLFLMFIAALFSFKRKDKIPLFLLGLFAFCFIASLRYSPIFWLMHKLPVFNLFRFPFRWMYLGAFLMSVLAAYGIDALRKGEIRPLFRLLMKVVAWLTGLTVFAVIILNMFGGWIVSRAVGAAQVVFERTAYGRFGFTKPIEHYSERFEPALQGFLRAADVSDPLLVVALGVVVLGAAFACVGAHRKMSETNFAIAAGLISVLTYAAVLIVQWPKHITREQITAINITHDVPVIRSDSKFFRTYPFRIGSNMSLSNQFGFSFEYPYEDAIMTTLTAIRGTAPNGNSFMQVPSIDGYEQFNIRSYLSLLTKLGSSYGAEDTTQELDAAEREAHLLAHLNILGMMAGKYVISGQPLTNAYLKQVATVTGDEMSATLYVYENDLALPRFYFATLANYVATAEEAGALAASQMTDFRSNTIIECTACDSLGPANSKDVLKLTKISNGHFAFNTELASDRWLIVSETRMPGWHAYLDGAPADIMPANAVYMAVLVPAGEHEVVFRYDGILGEGKVLRRLGLE